MTSGASFANEVLMINEWSRFVCISEHFINTSFKIMILDDKLRVLKTIQSTHMHAQSCEPGPLDPHTQYE